ncbi:uncharacterized protein LOC128034807 [Gossypium raimondii]|uniref:uncharacterized protein LOC128034807 n=1 Tax=Gossypium raimondii TaxID=29730 RepID=UPI00227A2B81|nr:uncharacterized protein LOC128034807 [Gossypium raimondii]
MKALTACSHRLTTRPMPCCSNGNKETNRGIIGDKVESEEFFDESDKEVPKVITHMPNLYLYLFHKNLGRMRMTDKEVPIILGRPFLATGQTLIDVYKGELTMRLNDELVTFSVFESIQCKEKEECHIVNMSDDLIEEEFNDQSTILSEEFAVTFDAKSLDDCDSIVKANNLELKHGWLIGSLDLANKTTPIFKPSIEEAPTLELKPLPPYLKYVKKKIIKWLDARIIYPIFDSNYVSPVQCVPKKSGITMVRNDKDDLIPTRIPRGWRVCTDYCKLNAATKKDHFLLSFIDQMLDRLVGKAYYCFLDGYSGYNQIATAPKDQEKTTFTCPFGTFTFCHMPFCLCNAPATF